MDKLIIKGGVALDGRVVSRFACTYRQRTTFA